MFLEYYKVVSHLLAFNILFDQNCWTVTNVLCSYASRELRDRYNCILGTKAEKKGMKQKGFAPSSVSLCELILRIKLSVTR